MEEKYFSETLTARSAELLLPNFLLGLLFDPEDGGDMVLRNIRDIWRHI
jgi:hypothetical protein